MYTLRNVRPVARRPPVPQKNIKPVVTLLKKTHYICCMTLTKNDKFRVLEINLEALKTKEKEIITITDEFHQGCINYLEQEERWDDCVLFRDNKSKLLGK